MNVRAHVIAQNFCDAIFSGSGIVASFTKFAESSE